MTSLATSVALAELTVTRPWGSYCTIFGTDYSGFKVKFIQVTPGKRLSLQRHEKRSEHWTVVKGTLQVQVGQDVHLVHPNQSVYIPKGVLHRAHNTGKEQARFIEVQVGEYLGEDDIERLEDDYGRVLATHFQSKL